MEVESQAHEATTIRIGAAGDLHCRESNAAELEQGFAGLDSAVDLVLLAGDLTAHGEPREAALLARAAAATEAPVIAVLGNHDWHLDRQQELGAVLTEAGITVLERGHTVCRVRGHEVGVVGAKGFVGGFAPSHLPDFGESLLRRVYAETSAEVEALDRGLHEVATCPFRIVLLHYAPTDETLEGERRDIWTFLGSDRLAAPILEHGPDLVLHGHAHSGALQGRIGEVPVYNVSVPVIDRDFWMLELAARARPAAPIH
jgi:uncharacterized protein